MLAVWALVLCGPVLAARWLDAGTAITVAYATAAILVVSTRPRGPRHGSALHVVVFALGLVAGLASHPVWIQWVARAGMAIGLAPHWSPPGKSELGSGLLAAALLAPLVEELLYRDRLLIGLRTVLPGPIAAVISALCFALPHAEPWAVLATFQIGIWLAAIRLSSGSTALCIGIHAGLNLEAWMGRPPDAPLREPLLPAIAVSSTAIGLAVLLARLGTPRSVP